MALLKRLPVRLEEEEFDYLGQLSDLMGLDKNTTIKQAVREALEARGIKVPAYLFGKNKEGRPSKGGEPDLPTEQEMDE